MSQQGAVVFIGGSRTITQLPALLHTRLERIVARDLAVVVGDAPGADAAVQGYFAERAYRHLVVYHSGTRCRTNVGAWPTSVVNTAARFATVAFYTAKDAAMTAAASCGLMLWDGTSHGTLANVTRLVQQGKLVLVYDVPAQTAITVRSLDDVAQVRLGHWQRRTTLGQAADAAD